MDELELHGIENFTPYIQKQQIPSSDLILGAKEYVTRLSSKYALPYEHALEDIVRSLTNGATRNFKKDVRLWLQKSSQIRKTPLNLTTYERKLADVIDNYNGDIFRSYTTLLEDDQNQDVLQTTVNSADKVDVIVNDKVKLNCTVHKKDCRTWLYKNSESQKRTNATDTEHKCEWYTFRNQNNPLVEIQGDGAGDTMLPSITVNNKTVSESESDSSASGDDAAARKPLQCSVKHKVRFRAPESDSSSNEDEENQSTTIHRDHKFNHSLKRTGNFNKRSGALHIDINEHSPPLKRKITTTSPRSPLQQNIFTNCVPAIKDICDISLSSSHTPNSNSITPCNSDSSRSSDEWQKISEADEIFARQIYESDLKVQKLEQQRKKEDYARLYTVPRSNLNSTKESADMHDKLTPVYETDEVNQSDNANSNSHAHLAKSFSIETLISLSESEHLSEQMFIPISPLNVVIDLTDEDEEEKQYRLGCAKNHNIGSITNHKSASEVILTNSNISKTKQSNAAYFVQQNNGQKLRDSTNLHSVDKINSKDKTIKTSNSLPLL